MLNDIWIYFISISGLVQFILVLVVLEIVALPLRALITWIKESNRRLLITSLVNKDYTPEDINRTLEILNKGYNGDE